MKYIMMMTGTLPGWKQQGVDGWTPDEAHMDFLRAFNKELTEAGELVQIVALTAPDQHRVVRARDDGPPTVTDGPFPEAKEFLAGYWIIDVDSPERAYELAGRVSGAPGPGGKPLNMTVELRPVMGGSGVEM